MRLVPLSALFRRASIRCAPQCPGRLLFAPVHGALRAPAPRASVPLDPKTDSAKCLECHEDKTKGKSVHSAMATGCLSCHEIRVNKDVTRVKLITATRLRCASPATPTKRLRKSRARSIRRRFATASRATIRTAATTRTNSSSLSGGEKENLCLELPQNGREHPGKGSRHAALDMGCDACHLTHKTGAEPTAENRFHLTKAAPALCLDCHDVKDAGLQKAHQNQPFAKANCLQCHDPHQSGPAQADGEVPAPAI